MNKSFIEKVHVQSIRTTKYEIHIILNNDQRAEGSLPANPPPPPPPLKSSQLPLSLYAKHNIRDSRN